MPITPHPRVLVGITTRNRSDILPKALRSALAQDYPSVTVAVLDDGSTDATPALAAGYPNVSWRRHEKSLGIIESRNELMREAEADYYLSLDDDAWFLRNDEISLAVAHLETHPRVAAVAYDILSPDRPEPVTRDTARPVAMFIGCGHLLRLSAAREIGFYAASPGFYGSEEKDLALRLADRGGRIDLLPGVNVWHDKKWEGRDWFPLHRSGVCNELALALRRCPLPDLLVVFPAKLFSFLRYWLRRPEFFRAGLAGIGDTFRHLGRIWRGRSPVRRATFWNSVKGRPVA
jgi:GT2 family glycosyltransferase